MPIARRPNQLLSDWVAGLPLFFTSSSEITQDVASAAKKGLVRKVGPRLYTTDTSTKPEQLLQRNALQVASLRFPGCVISHRTALEMQASDGVVFLTGARDRVERLAGLTIKVKRGPGPQPGDMEFLSLHVASPARAYLENLSYTRHSADVSRSLARTQIEARLQELLRDRGESLLNDLRDRARALAPALQASDGFEALDQIIGGLLRTRQDVVLHAPVAVAQQRGEPYDPDRVALFECLHAELRNRWAATSRPRGPLLREQAQLLAFIDAYFSNFIEGTKFTIDAAQQIVFEGHIPAARPADAHDVLGTFELLIDDSEMQVSATRFDAIEDFEYLLCRRHATIMRARPDKRPGEFKQIANLAGNTIFVAPELVRGTLARALPLLHTLDTPFQRAAFMMFVITEVHPFDDGNGRLARAMMNAELASADENRIVIVTSYRPDYLGALRRLSRQRDPSVYVRMLDRAHEFTARLEFDRLDALISTLANCNAFDDSEQRIMKLPPRVD